MRKIFQIPRQPEETWVHYIKRSTRLCVRKAREYGLRDWAETQQSRKAEFALRYDDDGCGKWNKGLFLGRRGSEHVPPDARDVLAGDGLTSE